MERERGKKKETPIRVGRSKDGLKENREVEVKRDVKEERRKGSAVGHNRRFTGLHSTALCLLVTYCL